MTTSLNTTMFGPFQVTSLIILVMAMYSVWPSRLTPAFKADTSRRFCSVWLRTRVLIWKVKGCWVYASSIKWWTCRCEADDATLGTSHGLRRNNGFKKSIWNKKKRKFGSIEAWRAYLHVEGSTTAASRGLNELRSVLGHHDTWEYWLCRRHAALSTQASHILKREKSYELQTGPTFIRGYASGGRTKGQLKLNWGKNETRCDKTADNGVHTETGPAYGRILTQNQHLRVVVEGLHLTCNRKHFRNVSGSLISVIKATNLPHISPKLVWLVGNHEAGKELRLVCRGGCCVGRTV